MRGFEPPAPCPPDKCATKLRYIPTRAVYLPFVEKAVNNIRQVLLLFFAGKQILQLFQFLLNGLQSV